MTPRCWILVITTAVAWTAYVTYVAVVGADVEGLARSILTVGTVALICAFAASSAVRQVRREREAWRTEDTMVLPRVAVGTAAVYRPRADSPRHSRRRAQRQPRTSPTPEQKSEAGVDPEVIDAARRLNLRLAKPSGESQQQ